MNIDFLKYKKIYFTFSGILILSSLISLILFGLNLGIEFTGGSILEVEYKERRPTNQEIREILSPFNLQEIIQPIGEKGVIIRMRDVSEDTRQEIFGKLEVKGEILKEKTHFESIGPIIGKELKEKAKIVSILSIFAILLYVTFAFIKVSRSIKSWKYGISGLICLFHDELIPIGVLSLLGKFYGVQVTIPIIAALLTVFGYSINNTIVVFDRLREVILKEKEIILGEAINKSLNQTLTRQINTSLTTLFVVLAIFLFGGETLKYFALPLILGITAGTYSSLFLATPILFSWVSRSKGD